MSRSIATSACRLATSRKIEATASVRPLELEAQQAVLAGDVAVDRQLVPFLGMADIVDRDVVVLAPEERHGVELLAQAEHVAAPRSGPGARRPPNARRGWPGRCAGRASARCRRRRRCRARWSRERRRPRRRDRSRAPPSRRARAAGARRRPRPRGRPRACRRSSASPACRRWRSPCPRDGRRRRAPRAGRARSRPSAGPRTRSIGRFSGATTWTSILRARREAATSRPMKLAPITTARRAVLARSMMARLSARVRSVWTCGWSAPGIGSRTGSAPVASSRRS